MNGFEYGFLFGLGFYAAIFVMTFIAVLVITICRKD